MCARGSTHLTWTGRFCTSPTRRNGAPCSGSRPLQTSRRCPERTPPHASSTPRWPACSMRSWIVKPWSWLPPGGMTATFERFDPRPGGSYRLILSYVDATGSRGKSSADADIVEVRYVDIVPDDRVVHAVDFVSDDPAFAGTMTMTWEVRPVAGLVSKSPRTMSLTASPPTTTRRDCPPHSPTSLATWRTQSRQRCPEPAFRDSLARGSWHVCWHLRERTAVARCRLHWRDLPHPHVIPGACVRRGSAP